MSKELVISATPHETRVAIMEDGQLCEIYIEREKEFALVGSLYKGRVTRVLPGMQSAFVDIGLDSDAFLYVNDFLEHLEEYDHVAPVEPKFRKPEPRTSEVFPPSTTNGGVIPAPRSVSEPIAAPAEHFEPAESVAPREPAGQVDAVPVITPLEGETIQVVAANHAAASEGGAQPAAPMQRNQHPPFPPRNDRGRGGFGNRGGQGGRNRRWGRPEQGGRGGRDRRPPGRDLPSSKYASPADSRPRESKPYEAPAADFEPVILPGESLSIFKERASSAPAASSTPHTSFASETSAAHPASRTFTDEELSAGLPGSLFTARPAMTPEEHETPVAGLSAAAASSVPEYVEASPDAKKEIARDLDSLDPESGPAMISDAHVTGLSEEDVTVLSEQLIEAKHEEAQADAEARSEAVEAVAESFVESAELEELQEALDTDHESDHEDEQDADQESDQETDQETDREDDHEDAAEEADALADEMHEEALAAEASPGLANAEEHLGGHEAEHGEGHAEVHGEAHGEVHRENQEEFHASAEAPHVGEAPPPTSARISEQPRARFQRPMRRGNRPQRGGRPNRPHRPPQHGHPRHEQHRRPQLISEMLKAGEEIIVQIAKEPLGKKGARITSHVALPGRFLVYMPTVDHIGVSRRIGSAEDRSRLRRLVTEAKGTFPGGFIVRTAASEASDEEIRTDVEFLGRTWDTIRATSEQRHAPSLLHRDLNLVQRILRDYLSDDYAAIWLDNEDEFTKVVEFVGRFQPKMVPRVKLYTKEAPIFEEFGIQQELDKALRPKVWLKSGGYIVINHTEALVAIDVNTGKYVGRGSTRLEDTIVKTNLEAVKEIVRQIRLRDLGGIIVVDFIDMEERRNREKVLSTLDQALQQDRAPSKALAFNEFGLVCITRKRTKQALERVLCQPCPYCTGSGMVKSIPTICYEIQTEAKKMAADLDTQNLTLRVNPEIAKALKTRESALIEDLERNTRKTIVIQSDPTLHWEQYDIY
jgi:Rne/Rng family ribonuclease